MTFQFAVASCVMTGFLMWAAFEKKPRAGAFTRGEGARFVVLSRANKHVLIATTQMTIRHKCRGIIRAPVTLDYPPRPRGLTFFIHINVDVISSNHSSITASSTQAECTGTMRQTTKINYAVQRQKPNIDDWDTIRNSITPPRSARPSAHAVAAEPAHPVSVFRLVKLEDSDDDHTSRSGMTFQLAVASLCHAGFLDAIPRQSRAPPLDPELDVAAGVAPAIGGHDLRQGKLASHAEAEFRHALYGVGWREVGRERVTAAARVTRFRRLCRGANRKDRDGAREAERNRR